MKYSRRVMCVAAVCSVSLGGFVVPAAPDTPFTPAPPVARAQPIHLPQVDPQHAQRLGLLAGLLAAVGVLGVVATQLNPDGSSVAAARQTPPSSSGSRTVLVGGKTRSYDVVRPPGWQPDVSYPIVIGLGGWQHTAGQTRGYQQLEREVDGNAIVVYAQGEANAWGGAPYAVTSLDEDIAYLRAVIADVRTRDHADASRVAAIGLSNGGGMATALACHAPDMVDAVASVAGAYYSPTVTGCTPGSVATLLIHATNDDVVAYGGGTRHRAHYESVPTVFNTFGRKNACADFSIETPGPATVTFDRAGCAAPTTLMRLSGGGHTWFTSPDATRESVQFVLGQL